MPSIAGINYLVRDVDEALTYFTVDLGFDVLEDDDTPGRRRVVVAPPGGTGAALVLKLAETDEQQAAVGRQGGGVVLFFLETEDFARDHARMRDAGVRFREEPRHEAYGSVAVFEDLYGNAWDLIQPA
ncbi:extradiol dioxygenase [Aeromicrobium sp. Root344]|uniref:VOC family protein n=1 Tax=Aeromicrobium sp. Root344 TaxID=1736521 RepID=UPI000701841D|nr:VOC family protein [Aeromicrobium sp. Root344]KQV73601.1 extradiol dioxygenase [Aeromicrobium sp. Root344]